MKKTLIVTAMALLTVSMIPLVATEISLAAAGAGQPQDDCFPKCPQHMPMAYDEHHGDHRHVGTDTDRNGDSLICRKHVGRDRYIHVCTNNKIPN